MRTLGIILPLLLGVAFLVLAERKVMAYIRQKKTTDAKWAHLFPAGALAKVIIQFVFSVGYFCLLKFIFFVCSFLNFDLEFFYPVKTALDSLIYGRCLRHLYMIPLLYLWKCGGNSVHYVSSSSRASSSGRLEALQDSSEIGGATVRFEIPVDEVDQ